MAFFNIWVSLIPNGYLIVDEKISNMWYNYYQIFILRNLLQAQIYGHHI